MGSVLLSLLAIFVLLMAIEYLWIKNKLHPEVARKIIHIVAGTFIAFWPFFMDWTTIQIICIALFVVVFVSHRYSIFGAIHNVKRSTSGELLYPLGIGLAAILTPPPWVFAAAVLHLAIADGLAAIIGVRYGQKNLYKVHGNIKSIAGSLAFFAVSVIILAVLFALNLSMISASAVVILICLPLLVTLIENFFIGGLDNVLVPLAVVLVLDLVPL